MPDIPIERLRNLREKADQLLDTVVTDLNDFRHDDELTFLRKPDSRSREDDVKVTTTCSCVMALALTGTFSKFYQADERNCAAKEVR